MFGIINVEAFVVAGLLLNLTPGADTFYILSRSIAQGRKAGIVSVLGISTGSIFHILLATLGLSVILAQSPLAFEIVKYAGAGYLVYLGLRNILKKEEIKPDAGGLNEHESLRKIFLSSILTNILDPKVDR